MARQRRGESEEFPPSYMVQAAQEIVGLARRLGVDPKTVGAPLASAMRSVRTGIARSSDPEAFIMGLMTAGDDPQWVLDQAGISPNRRRSSRRRTSRR